MLPVSFLYNFFIGSKLNLWTEQKLRSYDFYLLPNLLILNLKNFISNVPSWLVFVTPHITKRCLCKSIRKYFHWNVWNEWNLYCRHCLRLINFRNIFALFWHRDDTDTRMHIHLIFIVCKYWSVCFLLRFFPIFFSIWLINERIQHNNDCSQYSKLSQSIGRRRWYWIEH